MAQKNGNGAKNTSRPDSLILQARATMEACGRDRKVCAELGCNYCIKHDIVLPPPVGTN